MKEPARCLVWMYNEYFSILFENPMFAPAPGKHLLLYDEEGYVVAGGTIGSDIPGHNKPRLWLA
jgi:hypothetical protein